MGKKQPRRDAALREPSELEAHLAALDAMRATLRARIERAGATPEELALMRLLAGHDAMAWDALARTTSLSDEGLSRAVEALLERRLLVVTARRDAIAVVALTDRGRRALGRAHERLASPRRSGAV